MGDENSFAPRLCTIRKWPDFGGYGFNLHAERGRAGQYIGKVDDDSPAQAAGMKEGDRIVEVNGTNIGNENHSQVVTRIKAAGDVVTMLLMDPETDSYFKERKVVVSSDMPEVVRMETPPRSGQEEEEVRIQIKKKVRMDSTPEQASAPTEDNNGETENTTSNIDGTKQDVEDNKPGLDKEDNAPLYATVDKTSKEDQTGTMDNETDETAKQEENTESVGGQEKEIKEVARADSPVAARADSPRAGGDQAYIDDVNPYEEIEVQPATQDESTGVTETQETKENVSEERPPTPPASETPSEEPPSYNDVQDDDQQEPEETPESEPEPEPVPVPVVADTPSHDYHPRQCHIRKWPDFQGYGFNLHAEKEKKGQYIGLVDANSPADDAGLKKGDRIIEVNGENIEDTTHQQVIQKIKAGGEETILLVVDQDTDDFYKNNGIKITADLPEVIKGETTPRDSSSVPESSPYNPRLCHIIKWADFNGYGFNLHAEKERGGQYIGKIDAASPAEDGGLRENDRIIEVNGANVENETHQQVISRIKQGGDETKLLVVDRDADKYYKSKGVTVTSSMSEVKRMATARRSPNTSSAVTNGDSRPAPQQTRVEPAITNSQPTQANGTDFLSMNVSAKEMRERIASKKKNDPKQKSNMDFKSKFEIFQKM